MWFCLLLGCSLLPLLCPAPQGLWFAINMSLLICYFLPSSHNAAKQSCEMCRPQQTRCYGLDGLITIDVPWPDKHHHFKQNSGGGVAWINKSRMQTNLLLSGPLDLFCQSSSSCLFVHAYLILYYFGLSVQHYMLIITHSLSKQLQ